jgi:hypothetical protein
MDDAWRRYFRAGSLDPRPDLHRGQAEVCALFLQRMDEPPLYPAAGHQPPVFRLLCLPIWAGACVVRIERHGLTWRLTGRHLDGEAGFGVGKLVRRESRLLSPKEAVGVQELLDYLSFWSLPARDPDTEGFDTTSYLLEGVQHGQYDVVHREDPEWGDTFGEFSQLLLRLAGFAPR